MPVLGTTKLADELRVSDAVLGSGVIGGVGEVSGGEMCDMALDWAIATLGIFVYEGVGLLMTMPGCCEVV